jgi:hypothetical protein
MTLIKPQELSEESGGEQAVFIAGEVDTIKWNSGGVININIEYSIDNGMNFQEIVNNYPGDSARYFWAVPDSFLTRKAQIRIVESEDTSNEVESINFTIKPWQLTRLDASSNLELFVPNQDGWVFSNVSMNVWPQSWWQQFDYSGIDPYTGLNYPSWLTAFITAKPSDFPDWELFVDVFGVDNCYIQIQNTLTYNPIATARWGALILGLTDDWGGSCFGFAVSSLLYFYHKTEVLARFPNLPNQNNLFNVGLNNDSRYVVNFYFEHMFGLEHVQYNLTHLTDTPRELLADLKEMFRKEDGDGKQLSYFDNNLFLGGGHSVVPYRLERLGNTSVFNLRVANSNNPGSTNDIIQIDSTENLWTDLTGFNWGTGFAACYIGPESGEFLSQPSLYRPGIQTQSNEDFIQGNSFITIYNTSNADINLTNSTGNQIGYQDSAVTNIFPGAAPIIPLTGSLHPPIGYSVPNDNYSLHLSNYSDSLSYAFFFLDSTIYNYYRRTSLSNQEDYLRLEDNGIGITNPDQISKNIELETIFVRNEVGEKVFNVSNIDISSNDSLKVREVDRSDLLLQNYGEGTIYDLQLRYASEVNHSIFLHMSISMAQNSAHQIVPDWSDLNNEPVTILIDIGNDGTIDDTIFVKNQATNIEDEGSLLSPDSYNLAQNFPNPFNPTTSIRYSIPQRSNVSLKVYDILGNEVANLVNEEKDRGVYTVTFNAAGLSSGIYFYTLRADGFVQTKKMLLIK